MPFEISEKRAAQAVKILSLILAAALSFFVVTAKLPQSAFIQDSLESVEESSDTVMKLLEATLSASLVISALPDDFGTPLADNLADMNTYFIAILVVLLLEEILIRHGIGAVFAILIPLACLAGILFIITKKNILKGLAIRLCALGLAVAFVVPCSTHIAGIVGSGLSDYVDRTIEETKSGAGKLSEAMEEGSGDKTMFEKLSDLFQTAIRGVSDLLLHFQNIIRKCVYSIAILILTNCLMPLLTFLFLKWVLKELFQITIPAPPMKRHGGAAPGSGTGAVPELVSAGERSHEE